MKIDTERVKNATDRLRVAANELSEVAKKTSPILVKAIEEIKSITRNITFK